MAYPKWQPGEPPPEGFTVAKYTHCESCSGHEYLVEKPSVTIPEPWVKPVLRSTVRPWSYPPIPSQPPSRPYKVDFKDD